MKRLRVRVLPVSTRSFGVLKILALPLVLQLTACGGKQSPRNVGDTHENPAYDLDVELKEGADADNPEGTEPGVNGESPTDEAVVTFALTNTDTEELAFNMDRGWGGTILVYSGKRPNATSILPFARHCTASCEMDEAGICPLCPVPEHLADIRKAQKLMTVAAGQTLEVPWDGLIHNYEKAEGSNPETGEALSCECFRKEPAPKGEYTVQACGLRLTQTAKQSSQLQCVEATVEISEDMVPGQATKRVVLEFAAPKKSRR